MTNLPHILTHISWRMSFAIVILMRYENTLVFSKEKDTYFWHCKLLKIWRHKLILHDDTITWQSYAIFNVKVLGYWLKIGCWQKKMIVILERQTILESIFCLHSCPNMRHEPIIVHPVFKKIDTLYPTAHNNSFTKNNH